MPLDVKAQDPLWWFSKVFQAYLFATVFALAATVLLFTRSLKRRPNDP